jgi:hypothetical protein
MAMGLSETGLWREGAEGSRGMAKGATPWERLTYLKFLVVSANVYTLDAERIKITPNANNHHSSTHSDFTSTHSQP